MMNTITTLDEKVSGNRNIGEQLAQIRQEKAYTVKYVANQLNLRDRIIELIESNQFHLLPPQPVFVIGYLRAYAHLLGIAPEPFIEIFNEQYVVDKKPDRALLWQQTKPESNKAEHVIRLVTILFALGVIGAVGLWWEKNKDDQHVIPTKSTTADLSFDLDPQGETTEIKSVDISKMQSLLNPKPEMSPLEKNSG